MRKHELYEQALKQVQQLEKERAAAVATIEELCAEWNITLSDTNEEYIEQLLKDLQNRNDRVEQLKEELFAKELLLNDFREAMDKAIKEKQSMSNEIKLHKADKAGLSAQIENKDLTICNLEKEIDEMKKQRYLAEKHGKNNSNKDYEKLYAEYSALRNSHGELSEAYDILAEDIARHNDTIEELKIQIDIQKEELEYYHGKEKEYDEDVEGMEMDIEALQLQMEGMKFAYWVDENGNFSRPYVFKLKKENIKGYLKP